MDHLAASASPGVLLKPLRTAAVAIGCRLKSWTQGPTAWGFVAGMRPLSRWQEEQPLCQPSCSYTFELESNGCLLVSTGKQLRQERQKLRQLFASLGCAALCNLGLLVRCPSHAASSLMF